MHAVCLRLEGKEGARATTGVTARASLLACSVGQSLPVSERDRLGTGLLARENEKAVGTMAACAGTGADTGDWGV